MELSARARWIAQILEIGLRDELFEDKDLLAHVDPDAMATHLPEDVMAQVLSAALEVGELTPSRLLDTATPEVLAMHIPHELLWACVTEAARRAGMDKPEP